MSIEALHAQAGHRSIACTQHAVHQIGDCSLERSMIECLISPISS
jgi:hypothetical protein